MIGSPSMQRPAVHPKRRRRCSKSERIFDHDGVPAVVNILSRAAVHAANL